MSLCEKDYDECTASTDRCHASAICQNIPGSYTCPCGNGSFWNGRDCSGNYDYFKLKARITFAIPYSVECISCHMIC